MRMLRVDPVTDGSIFHRTSLPISSDPEIQEYFTLFPHSRSSAMNQPNPFSDACIPWTNGPDIFSHQEHDLSLTRDYEDDNRESFPPLEDRTMFRQRHPRIYSLSVTGRPYSWEKKPTLWKSKAEPNTQNQTQAAQERAEQYEKGRSGRSPTPSVSPIRAEEAHYNSSKLADDQHSHDEDEDSDAISDYEDESNLDYDPRAFQEAVYYIGDHNFLERGALQANRSEVEEHRYFVQTLRQLRKMISEFVEWYQYPLQDHEIAAFAVLSSLPLCHK